MAMTVVAREERKGGERMKRTRQGCGMEHVFFELDRGLILRNWRLFLQIMSRHVSARTCTTNVSNSLVREE